MDATTFLSSLRTNVGPCALDLSQLFSYYREVEDLRHRRGVRYPLWLLLSIATLAKLAGINRVHAIADWAQQRQRELASLFQFYRFTMPVASTWSRALAHAVDVEALNKQVQRLMRSCTEQPGRGSLCVSLDGKTLRGTIWGGDTAGVHLLALYWPNEGVVLAQVEVGSKANEITAAPRLLAMVDLRGMVVTGDALFTQRELSLQIVQAGGDYLWSVKKNQPRLLDRIATVFQEQPQTAGWGRVDLGIEVAVHTQKAHGRLEKRTLWSSSALQDYSDWPHLVQVFRLETISTHLATQQTTTTVRYGITSLPRDLADPQRLLELVRSHWDIESRLHYRRDVDFEEDACHTRLGHAPHLNATLNSIALCILDRLGAISIPAARRRLAYHIERLVLQARSGV